MDDWQETAFSHKHVHNRVSKAGKSSKKGGGIFNVRNTFGSYEIECRAYSRIVEASSQSKASLEIYGLIADGEALHGRLSMPGVLEAKVILAASRKSMSRVVASVVQQSMEAQEPDDDDGEAGEGNDGTAGSDSVAESEEESEEPQEERPSTFEKNTFRSPKFWIKWQGSIASKNSRHGASETNDGYIVFTPDVVKFNGTITCEGLDWKNTSITGRKLKTTSERDVALEWQ